jgi:hypothetical protein
MVKSVMQAIAVEPSLTMEKQVQSATLTICGGGNALLVHLGAVHRLYENRELRIGEKVTVFWDGLLNDTGHLVSGRTGPLIVKSLE